MNHGRPRLQATGVERPHWRHLADLRVAVWLAAAALLWLCMREWTPHCLYWQSWPGHPWRLQALRPGTALAPAAIVFAAALAGAARACRGRSRLNGAYLAFCLLALPVSGATAWAIGSQRLAASDDHAEVRLYGFYFRSLARQDALRVDVQPYRVRGSTGYHPVVVRHSGGRVHLVDWQFTRRLAQRWQLPASPQAREILDRHPADTPP
ncbi:hypothetical protein HNR76_000531 [Pseudoxanthomonas broegbernensis]|uniref:hypothetical protein n=1 Tax=Pseudoxanthomonas broegbernensis TaxID=83619 RepID=UPI00161DF660|nr:hypothetical protein [Pseudoxanthomonas broegbernensis]MBB6064005.1 hypothetical protein [Pseudoxanthomonas broegbernensis]